MIVDELILKLQADLGDIKKSLKQVEADAAKAGKDAGAKMGKEAGTSFGDVFNAIAGAAVLNTVKGFFSKAAAEFNKMEAAMMRVDSIAKGFGRSVEVAKKQVKELADKGFLNLNQAASGYADAIALGFDEKQARKFIDSLSDIAAFQNTIGNGAEAVQSGLAGLLSNSAEKVENIGVPIKVLNQEYQKNIATMGKAAALQKFYAATLKESEKFQGDAARSVDTLAGAQNKYNAAVDKAQVAIGKGLEPMLKALYSIGNKIATSFAEWFNSLHASTKMVVLITSALMVMIPTLATMIPLIRGIGASFTALLANPVVLTLVAITAALGAMAYAATEAYQNFKTPESTKMMEQKKAIEAEIEALKGATNKTKELAEAKSRLDDVNKQLNESYGKWLKSLGEENANYERKLVLLANLEKAEHRLSADKSLKDRSLEELSAKSKALEGEFAKGASALSSGRISKERYEEEAYKVAAEKAIVDAEIESRAGGKAPTATGMSGTAKQQRFLASAETLAEIEKNRAFTLRQIGNPDKKGLTDEQRDERKRQIDAAIADADQQIEAEFTTRRQAYAEFIEDKYMADTEALKKSTDDAIRASNELLEANLKQAKNDEWAIAALKEENAERLQEINEAYARKNAAITLQSFTDTANAGNAMVSAAGNIARSNNIGSAIGGGGQLFSGIGGLSEKLKGFGIFGQGISAVGGAIGTLTSLFGKSDAERQKEAAQQAARDEEARKLLELQANYQKGMLALQEAAAKLPFENLQRNLRLIDIQSQKDSLNGVSQATVDANRSSQRNAALQGVLTSQAGEIGKGEFFSGTQSTPDALIQFLSERAAQSLAIQQFVQLMSAFQNAFTEGVEDQNYWDSLYSQINSYRGKVPDKFFNYLDPLLRSRTEYVEGFSSTANRGNFIRGLSATFGSFSSEISSDTGIAENLLSVIEQSNQIQLDIAGNTRKTAENTSKALELRPDRERSFIDVGAGFIQSLGQRITSPSGLAIAQQLSQQNFSVSGDIGTASVTSSRARTLQERMADALEKQLAQGATANDILRDIRALTYDLIAVMDSDASTGSSFSQQDFINFSSDVKRRRVA